MFARKHFYPAIKPHSASKQNDAFIRRNYFVILVFNYKLRSDKEEEQRSRKYSSSFLTSIPRSSLFRFDLKKDNTVEADKNFNRSSASIIEFFISKRFYRGEQLMLQFRCFLQTKN